MIIRGGVRNWTLFWAAIGGKGRIPGGGLAGERVAIHLASLASGWAAATPGVSLRGSRPPAVHEWPGLKETHQPPDETRPADGVSDPGAPALILAAQDLDFRRVQRRVFLAPVQRRHFGAFDLV